MLQKVTRLDSVPTAEETVLTTEVPTKESRLYTLLVLTRFIKDVLRLFDPWSNFEHVRNLSRMVKDVQVLLVLVHKYSLPVR